MAEQLAYSVLEPLKDNASELILQKIYTATINSCHFQLTINTKGCCCDSPENSAHKQSDYKVIMQVL